MRLDLAIDVGAAADLDMPIALAVTVYLPAPDILPTRPVAIFAAPGGGYSRHYFDLRIDGHPDYSEADYHVARGTIYVTIDHIGVGDSTIPELSRIDFQTLAATHDAAVRALADMLRNGTLTERFPPVPDLFTIGMGQSMGGGVTTLAQGRFATFDAIAPCGVSAIHTVLPQPTADKVDAGKARFARVDDRSSHETVSHDGVDYVYPFHWEDVPAYILALDMAGGYPIRQTAPPFGSLTIPHIAVQMMTPGCFAADAARVSVPVLIANGERDTCPNPHAEAAAYPASPDVSILIVPRMAHMHNFASTRALLWERLHRWSRMVSQPV